jgi:hypothetical protein
MEECSEIEKNGSMKYDGKYEITKEITKEKLRTVGSMLDAGQEEVL